MINHRQLAMWNAVADIDASVWALLGNPKAAESESAYPVEAEKMAALDAALAAGADPNLPLTAEDYFDWMTARQTSQADSVHKIYQQFPDYHRGRLIYVLGERLDYEVARRLLASGADPNLPGSLHYAEEPVLHHLIRSHDIYHKPAETLIALLEAGAEVDLRGPCGRTPLQLACSEKSVGGFIGLLLKYGASVSAVDDFGFTALHSAAHHDEGYCPWPLDRDETLRDDPFHCGPGEPRNEHYRIWGAREVVNRLIDAGADPNALDPQTGNTPMHLAVDSCFLYQELMEALFERDGRVDLPNHKGIRPIDLLDYHIENYADQRARQLKEKFK